MKLSFLFIYFIISFLLFFLILLLQRCKQFCFCHACKSYINSSWKLEFKNLSDWYAHLLSESPTQTIQIHVFNNTITANPDNIKYMLKTKFENFPKGKPFQTILQDLLGHGIFNVDGDAWRFQRKLASLELGSLSVRSYAFSIVKNEIEERLLPLFMSVSDTEMTIDLQDVFRRFSFDTICKISLGLDPKCLHGSMIDSEFEAFDSASNLSAIRALSVFPVIWKIKRYLNIGSERKLKRAIHTINMLANEVILQKRQTNYSSDNDLLSRFMVTVDDDKYLRDIVVSFLLAGRDTVASSLTTFFFLIAKNPVVVRKIREELKSALDDDEINKARRFDYNKLRSMHYLHAAIYESLRLFPPVQFDSKFCSEDDVLPDGTTVKKDAKVTYHAYAIGRMRSIWGDDWHVFEPDRWLNNSGEFVPACQYKYPVFQGGARICSGKEMADMEIKTVVVEILSEFDIELCGDYVYEEVPRFASGLTTSISGGLTVKVRMRDCLSMLTSSGLARGDDQKISGV